MANSKDARMFFGPKQPLEHIIKGADRFYVRTFGEYLGRSYQEDDLTYLERILHELGHYYSLKEEFEDAYMMGERIASLGPMAQDGNEIDALAFSIVTSQWLQHRLTFQIIKDTVSLGNIKLVTSIKVLRCLVRSAMSAPETREISFALAKAIYEESYLAEKEDNEDDEEGSK